MSRRTWKRPSASGSRDPLVVRATADPRVKFKPKVWLFRIALALGLPSAVFLGVEILLRLIGFGNSASFFLPARIGGHEVMLQNDRFGWRFFGADLAREPFPLAISKTKPADTVRIFVFGESAAYGDPQPDFGLARLLEALLGKRYPERRFEVVNVAMTAINSHAVLPIARDCARQNGDIWVVYMGNNEVVGPFGAGTVFGSGTANLAVIRASLAVKATRTGQLLGSLTRGLYPASDAKREWGGMAMFLGNQVREQDPRMASVYSHFQRNLEDILDAGHRGGAQVLLSTVASNLKDCAPFASLHAPELSKSALDDWQRLYDRAREAERGGRPNEAVESLGQAARLDDAYAELQYLWGRCCFELGRNSEAAAHFTKARDLDTLRFRADSRINEIIREVSAKRQTSGVRLIDAERRLGERSDGGVPGDGLFYEHVHLNFEGNYELALAFADQIAQVLAVRDGERAISTQAWASAGECAQRLAWTKWSQYRGITAMLGRISDPPFTDQFNHSEQYGKMVHELEAFPAAVSRNALEQHLRACQAASADFPQDWILVKELALAQEKQGDFAGAVTNWQQIVRKLPHYAEAWQQLGLDLASRGQEADAISALREALRLNSMSAPARSALAEILAHQGKMSEAAEQYETVLKLRPYWGQAHIGLGKALEANGRAGEAEGHFRAALQTRVYTPVALNALGRLCFEKGWFNEAVTNFLDAVKLDPSDVPAHVNLGVTLLQLGRYPAARDQFAEALRLDPSFAEAHVRLGVELGREGRDAEAAIHFGEAARLKPTLLEARLDLGIALMKQQRNVEALETFEQVLRQDPTNAVALKNLQRLRGGAR